MAADKVLTDLAKRYIETLPPVSQNFDSIENNSFSFERVLLNYQQIMFVHH
jgi:hypothetical protein